MQRLLFIVLIAITGILGAQEPVPISLEDIYLHNRFREKSVTGLRSMNDGQHYTISENDRIIRYSYRTGLPVDTLFSYEKTAGDPGPLWGYEFSTDETKILLTVNHEKIYRRSYMADHYVWDIREKKLTPVSTGGKQQAASLSPNGLMVAFVRNNNLYLKSLLSGEERALTTDGLANHIINGVADWVYEEEFGFTRAYEWSPDSHSIAFYRFDETRVPLFNMTLYKGKLYPQNYTFKYPKAGDPNARVEIWVCHLLTGNMVKMDTGEEDDQYIPRIGWTTDPGLLSMIRMNRLQNKLEILLSVIRSGFSQVVYTEENKYYIEEVTDNTLTFLSDGSRFVINSEKDGHNHFYLYSLTGKLINQITSGDWDVHSLLGIDEKRNMLYYTSSESSPLQRDVYRIRLDGRRKEKISTLPGTNRAVFSKGFAYYILDHSSSATPRYISLHDSGGKLVRVLEDNAELKEKVHIHGVAPGKFFSFTTSEGVELNGWMIKPPGFDPSVKYPVLMRVYGGPGSQTVTDSWDYGWNQYLAQRGYIIVSVDNRGTGSRGEEFKKMTYGQLGKYETIDQIEAARYLGSLPFVDAGRIGIFGWSYGGFMAASCLFKGNDVFRAAVSVAPVTSWRFYDTIYTERFMGLPQNNPGGYDDNSPLNFVHLLKGKLLLVHGTADDNVHFQNSMELVEKLVQAGKDFDMHFYPDRDHGIRGGNTSLHLYYRISRFIEENL